MNLLFWYRSLMRSVGATLVKLIATATSGLVSFTTNVIRPVKVTCEFSPIQEGTGDPSPDNVRPISGWTGCVVEQRGKNLLDSSDYSGIRALRYSDGTFTETGTDGGPFANIYFCRTYKNRTRIGNYSLIDDGAGRKACNITVNVRNIDTIQIGFLTFGDNAYVNFKVSDVIAESGTYNISYNLVTAPTSNTLGAFNDVQISKTDSSYESYHGTALSITFTDPDTGDPMTVYGGTVTLNEDGSADLVATHRFITYDGSESWQAGILKNSVYGSYIRNTETASILGESPIVAWSNMAKQGNGAYTQSSANQFCAAGNWLYYSVNSSVATTVEELKTFLSSNNLQVVYPLRTTTTYHFPSIGQLQSFLGENNIWHDMNGDITVEYWNKQ